MCQGWGADRLVGRAVASVRGRRLLTEAQRKLRQHVSSGALTEVQWKATAVEGVWWKDLVMEVRRI